MRQHGQQTAKIDATLASGSESGHDAEDGVDSDNDMSLHSARADKENSGMPKPIQRFVPPAPDFPASPMSLVMSTLPSRAPNLRRTTPAWAGDSSLTEDTSADHRSFRQLPLREHGYQVAATIPAAVIARQMSPETQHTTLTIQRYTTLTTSFRSTTRCTIESGQSDPDSSTYSHDDREAWVRLETQEHEPRNFCPQESLKHVLTSRRRVGAC